MTRPTGMATERRFKFDVGDWVARLDERRGWVLVGKVVDADSESCTVESRMGVRYHYAVGEDPIARVRWIGRGRWTVA